MNEPTGLHERVTRLEERMADVYELATRTDREVASWRGVLKNHTEVLNGMSNRLDLFERKVERFERKVDARFAQVDARFAQVETKMQEGFTMLSLGQAQITALLNIALGNSDET